MDQFGNIRLLQELSENKFNIFQDNFTNKVNYIP